MLSFKVTDEEADLIDKIAERARRELRGFSDTMHTHMDLSATIAQGQPLRLAELLASDPFNFAHDMYGIGRHLNRTTGKLENCFVPRFSA